MVKNVNIFDIGKRHGSMNGAPAFFPKEKTAEERAAIFLERRIKLGELKGFDGHKFFMAWQKEISTDKDVATYDIITPKLVESEEDTWSIDLNNEFLILTPETPRVVAGHPIADCPVVIITDQLQGLTAVAHCGGAQINGRLPIRTIDTLLKKFGSKEENLRGYVSSCAGPNWTYDSYPNWATDEAVWKNSITKKDSLYYINLRQALKEQFAEREIQNMIMNPIDTITNNDYYSNAIANNKNLEAHVKEKKAGRNFTGAFYK